MLDGKGLPCLQLIQTPQGTSYNSPQAVEESTDCDVNETLKQNRQHAINDRQTQCNQYNTHVSMMQKMYFSGSMLREILVGEILVVIYWWGIFFKEIDGDILVGKWLGYFVGIWDILVGINWGNFLS